MFENEMRNLSNLSRLYIVAQWPVPKPRAPISNRWSISRSECFVFSYRAERWSGIVQNNSSCPGRSAASPRSVFEAFNASAAVSSTICQALIQATIAGKLISFLRVLLISLRPAEIQLSWTSCRHRPARHSAVNYSEDRVGHGKMQVFDDLHIVGRDNRANVA